jgi:hypothetical protein
VLLDFPNPIDDNISVVISDFERAETVAKKSKRKVKLPELTVQEEKFCQLFVSDKEFIGNGTQSYIEAFEIDLKKKNAYQTARVQAHNLLTNININTRIKDLIETELTEVNADKQLSFLIIQNAELSTKLGAIKEFNALKNRIKTNLNISGQVELLPPSVK